MLRVWGPLPAASTDVLFAWHFDLRIRARPVFFLICGEGALMSRTSRHRSRSGFTLIELLVVIAIIAILIA